MNTAPAPSFVSKLLARLPFKKTSKDESMNTDKTVAPISTEVKKSRASMKAVKIGAVITAVLVVAIAATGGLIYFLVQPVIANGQKTMALAKESYQFLKTQDLPAAEAKLKETKESLLQTQQDYRKLSWLRYFPVISTYQQDGEAAFNAGIAGIEAAEIAVAAVSPYADVLGFKGQGSFEGGTAEDRIAKMVETFDKVTPKMEEISMKLVTVKTEMDKINPNDYPEQVQGKQVRSKLLEVESLIEEMTVAVTDARPIIEVLPQILGYPEGKKYLVLFQNDGELRPTGGFMSAFAVLHVDKGRVKAEKSDDIYSLDNKFNKRIEPPEAIKKYLNEKVWHLRNMNMSPDFKVAMDTFEPYYNELPGEYEVDGIVAIDTEVLKRIVEVTGPLEVTGYGTFTTENDKRCNLAHIVCELEHIIDKPLATLVTNRKSSILGPMMQALLQKSMGGGKEQLAKLLPLGFELLEEKHIQVYFKDETAQKAAEAFNIAGRIVEFDGDYLAINNTNLGGAKSNFYIEDTVEQDIDIQPDGTIVKKVTISYTHTEPMDNCNLEAGQLCLSGIQRNYFRVYVPKGSVLNGNESLGSQVEMQTGEEFGKTYFDGFFELRPESKVKVQLTYTLPFKAQPGQDYKLLVQKQAGTKNDTHIVRISGKEEEFELNKDTQKSWKI